MLHLAVAGSPLSTPSPGGTVEGLKQAARLGITAMELEWVKRVPTNPERLEEIKSTASVLNIYLTVHAPYFINLNSSEPDKLEKSKIRILTAMEMGQKTGAHSVCVHPAFYMKTDPVKTYDNVAKATEEILKERDKNKLTINLAYETMGKHTQFGTYLEALKISREFGLYPCVDFAHLHARTNGALNTSEEWNRMLDEYESYLGKGSLNKVHFHYSGINYTEKGERNHLPLKDSDANWIDFLQVLKNRRVGGTLVCESPVMEDDTLLMKKQFERM